MARSERSMIEYLVGITVSLIVVPVLVYLSVKLGTYGYLKAHQRFVDQQRDLEKKVNHGSEST